MRLFAVMMVGFANLSGLARAALAREPGDPIRLVWTEGDVAGMSTIWDPAGREPVGFVEYHQIRRGDRLVSLRTARFRDGSSDEDSAEARLDDNTLEAVSGRSIIRDASGVPIVDLTIDVQNQRVVASWGRGEDRRTSDERVALPKGTYWGPLIFIVLKNFDANAENGRLAFHTVAPTPKPIALDMEVVRGDTRTLERTNIRIEAQAYRLTPTIHWLVDPVVRMIAPAATFWLLPGEPPALARFAGPRNYGRQEIVIQ